MEISIAMASYNGGSYLRQQLDSFAAQTRLPDELVICDDGSSDETAEVIAAFANHAPFPVRFERNPERLGYNGNFARALDRCEGRILFISDQDDVWFPEKIATVFTAFSDRPEVLAIVNDQVVANAGGEAGERSVLQNVRALGYPDSFYGPGCCTALRREWRDALRPFPGRRVTYDHWINGLASHLGVRLLIDEVLQLYRRHESNTSGSVFAQARPGILALIRTARANDARRDLAAKVDELDAMVDHLRVEGGAIDALGLADRRRRALSDVTAERNGYAARVALLERSRIGRIVPIARSLATGGYGRFQGVRTAAKDWLS